MCNFFPAEEPENEYQSSNDDKSNECDSMQKLVSSDDNFNFNGLTDSAGNRYGK